MTTFDIMAWESSPQHVGVRAVPDRDLRIRKELEVAESSDGKRRIGDRGLKLLDVGFYVNKELAIVPANDSVAFWEGFVINVPATVFQEEDPQGFYSGHVRCAPLPGLCAAL